MTNWEKVDKFYLVLISVLIMMAVLVVMSFRGIFSAYLTGYELGPEVLNGKQVKVDKQLLDSVYAWTFNRPVTKLEIRE